MAEIQEYLPQVENQGPVGGTSPNLELGGAVGRGMQRVGAVIGEAADAIHRRNVQEEQADTYASFADHEADTMGKLQQKVQDGSLDVDKFIEEYDSNAPDGENISTREGRNYFERRQSRLRSRMIQKAVQGKAIVTANNTKVQMVEAMGKVSSTLEADPTHFNDAYNEGIEMVDEMIKSGGLPDKMREQAIKEMGAEYSRGALRGWSKISPEEAKKRLESGAFDEFLNTDQKKQMRGEIHQDAAAREVESIRAERAQQRAQKATSEAWISERFPALRNGSLSMNEVNGAVKKGILTWEQGDRILDIADRQARQELKSDPRARMDLMRRILNPGAPDGIHDSDQIMQLAASGKINTTDLDYSTKLFHMTKDGQKELVGQKAMLKLADGLRFKNITGQDDPRGDMAAAQFMFDAMDHREQILKNGGTVMELYDPHSKNYLGKLVEHYRVNWQDQMQMQAQDQEHEALGLKGGINENPVPVPGAKQPDEDMDSFLLKKAKERETQSETPPRPMPEPPPGKPAANDDVSFMLDQLGITGEARKKHTEDYWKRKREMRARGR